MTRGDIANIEVSAKLQDGQFYTFHKGDVVRFSVCKKRGCATVLIKKDHIVEEDTQTVTIHLNSEDTKIEGIIITPVDYWYEIEVNPETAPQTIVGYDATGEKIFRLYPESGDA